MSTISDQELLNSFPDMLIDHDNKELPGMARTPAPPQSLRRLWAMAPSCAASVSRLLVPERGAHRDQRAWNDSSLDEAPSGCTGT